jgi:hypothetical protein
MSSHGWLSTSLSCTALLALAGVMNCGGGGGASTETPGGVAPSITAQPQNRTVTAGHVATFSVTAAGTSPFTYLWKRDGTAIGANAPNYTTPATGLADNSAKFTVTVTNSAGHADSSDATLTVNPSTGSAIIITHTHTNLSQVPSAAITAAKNTLKIAYGHTSHGSQLLTGMGALDSNPLYSFNNGGSGGALDLHEAWGNDLGNPNFTQWATDTRTYLDNPANADVNVVLWSWCGQVSGASVGNIDTYLSLMNQLESDYPAVQFVYMTGHLDGTGTNGTLNQRNEQIRSYCLANNKILFDFADIESFDPDGSTNYMALNGDDGCGYSGGNWADAWIAAPTASRSTASRRAAPPGGCGRASRAGMDSRLLRGALTQTALWQPPRRPPQSWPATCGLRGSRHSEAGHGSDRR